LPWSYTSEEANIAYTISLGPFVVLQKQTY